MVSSVALTRQERAWPREADVEGTSVWSQHRNLTEAAKAVGQKGISVLQRQKEERNKVAAKRRVFANRREQKAARSKALMKRSLCSKQSLDFISTNTNP